MSDLAAYWHDLYLREVTWRYQILEALALPVSADERLAQIQRIADRSVAFSESMQDHARLCSHDH